MNPERFQHIEELYHSAREREPGERGAFLAQACRDDEELRREVESLLAQDGSGGPPGMEQVTASLPAAETVTQVTVGTLLGPYKIEAPLGAGGMGQVYRGRDTRLGRAVAIKIVNQQFSERFEREARAISALNHPRICTLYDVGPNYLVMELVEGETLTALLRRGSLSIALVLRYSTEIADALVAAHAQGITHRDLKPANIMVTKSGIKVLDFGLAKIAPSLHAPPAALLTAPQAVMGTLAYMAPEQLEGKECDARSDIFSLGLVISEMATGKRAFQGENNAALLEARRSEPPGLSGALPSVPEKLAHAVKRCVAQDPEDRWQTARDLKAELEWAAAGDLAAPPPVVARRALFPWIAGTAVVAASGAGLAAWAWRGQSPPRPTKEIRFRLAPPEGAWLARQFTQQSLALSPVGGRVAMIATGERGPMVWVQRLDSLTASPLPGTEGATTVFWSPDAEFIGFWAGGKLKKIAAEGGTPLPICDLPAVGSATWNQDGIIVAETAVSSSIISIKSGAIRPGPSLRWAKFLPGGKQLLYVKRNPKTFEMRAQVGELSSGRETELMPTDTKVTFTPDQPGSSQGYLLFGRSATLLALRFDVDRLRVAGEPVSVAKDVPFFNPNGWSEFDTSPEGVLIYATGSQEEQLTWVDRSGRELSVVSEPRDFFGFLRLTADGKRLAADVFDFSSGGVDIWIYNLSQATAERVTFEPGGEYRPIWSHDETRIAYGSGQTGIVRLKVKALTDPGVGDGFPGGAFQFASDWTADGRWIFYTTSGGDMNAEIWLASVADRKLIPLLQTQFDTAFPALSPDQGYLAFSANDTGRSEIYVQRFQGGDSPKLTGERRRISQNGGNAPRWRHDGKELFFLSPDRQITAVAVKPGTPVEFGPPAALFGLPTSFRSLAPVTVGFEVSPDGQQFLVPVRKAVGAPLQVVVNWQAGLKG